MHNEDISVYFKLFTEVGIIEQLSRALFEARLPDGLLMTHFSVLNHLVRVRDGQTPLTLARAFQVPKTSLTHTLAGLEKRELIRMDPNPKDARSKCVFVTDAGRRFLDEAVGRMGQDIGALASAIPPEDISALLPGLEQIRRYLDAERNVRDGLS